MGPLGESYRPDLTPPVAVSAPLYAEKARILAPHVDVILLETMSSLDLARGALQGAQAAGLPVWLSVSVHDRDGGRLRSGEPISGLRDLIAEHPTAALLANCSMPEAMLAALTELSTMGLPFGAYANGFSEISNLPLPDAVAAPAYTHRHDLTPEKYADFAMTWVNMGATIVGGCCEVGPAHIRHLAARLKAEGHTIA
jgi:homocysteine S-methyltransferase